MANDQQTRGLIPIQHNGVNVRVNIYRVATGADLFLHQPVVLNSDGLVAGAGVTDGSQVLGVITGFLDTNRASIPSAMASLTQGAYLPNGNEAYAIVADDPDQIFLIEEGTGGTALAQTNVGNTINVAYEATTGNTITGFARCVLDQASVAADTNGMLRILQLADNINSDGTVNAAGNFARWLVTINEHQLAKGEHGLAV